MDKDSGGPAFPHVGNEYNSDSCEREPVTTEAGMTLRDYFAAKAMQEVLLWDAFGPDDCDAVAAISYKQADAMLRARQAG